MVKENHVCESALYIEVFSGFTEAWIAKYSCQFRTTLLHGNFFLIFYWVNVTSLFVSWSSKKKGVLQFTNYI